MVAVSAASIAQGGRMFMGRGGGGSPTMLLMRDDVKHDLTLTDEQKDKLAKLQEDARSEMQEKMQSAGIQFGPDMTDDDRKKMRTMMETFQAEQEAKVNAIISADQQKRLLQIFVQLNGNSSITNKTVQKGLVLTDDQLAKIKSLQAKQQAAMQETFQKMQSGELDRSEIRPLMEKNNNIMKEELGKVLTEAQKKKLKDMEGEKKFVPDPEEQGGGPRPGGGR